jgi:hypothetical protein
MIAALQVLLFLLLSSVDASPVVNPLKVLTATLALAGTATGASSAPDLNQGIIPHSVSKFQKFADSFTPYTNDLDLD